MIDIDDTIVEVHGYNKQGASFGYSGVRDLNALLATVSTDTVAPVIAAQRLRKGSAGSSRRASRLLTDTLALVRRTHLAGRQALVRLDSAFYSHAVVSAATRAGAQVSVTARMDPAVKRAIASIGNDAWTTIKYPDAIFDQGHRPVDLQGPGRRGPLHRVLLQEARRPDPRAPGRAPHPRPEPQGRRWAAHVVRHLAVPHVLHHHTTGPARHRRRRSWTAIWPPPDPRAPSAGSAATHNGRWRHLPRGHRGSATVRGLRLACGALRRRR